MSSYSAVRCHLNTDTRQVRVGIDTLPIRSAESLAHGEVAIAVAWSGINYKDALAATGAGRIMRRFPLTAGIDVAGVVEASNDARWRVGDPAIVVGCGLGEDHDGGFAERAYVHGDWIVRPPAALTLRDAMAIGTAGFTAALAIERMEHNDLAPTTGPIAVTGATGGVGSFAIALLASRGYRVSAVTRKIDRASYLTRLGATEVVDARQVPTTVRPLESAQWAGGVDAVGGPVLAWLCATTLPLGVVASVGLAGSAALETTVMPFILRGVQLLGINSTWCPAVRRDAVWQRLATDVRRETLDAIVQRTVSLAELPDAFSGYVEGTVTGRTLVRVSGALG